MVRLRPTREFVPGGVDATLELVGTPTLRDSLEATRVHGVVCAAGYLSNEWIVPDFYPSGFLPNGVRLTGYFGDASDLPQAVLQEFLDAVAAGEATVPIAKTYTMDEIASAHDDMEHDRVAGKLVVSTGRSAFLEGDDCGAISRSPRAGERLAEPELAAVGKLNDCEPESWDVNDPSLGITVSDGCRAEDGE